ncbi:ureidoglycolate lyase [Trinickia sp. LjRoot230]|uniref:ureidoglycolate lyase n=1 Tax=Trinickia sp. LjRoot230 TaxID=3342288 RepID=UPI003ECEA0E2
MRMLSVEPLTRQAFAPFGDVIELEGARHFPINGGTTERFHDLARIDVADGNGRAIVNVFRAEPHAFPIEIRMMERHPLGSQAFVPLGEAPYLVVVAPSGSLDANEIRAFVTYGWQGVNYGKGVWHHPLLALGRSRDFIVIDRGGEGANCDEVSLDTPWRIADWRQASSAAPRVSGNVSAASTTTP